MNDDLDLALERLRATANRSLQNQADLDFVFASVIGLRAEIKRLEDELTLQQGLLATALEAAAPPEEVRLSLDYREPMLVDPEPPGVVVGDIATGTEGQDRESYSDAQDRKTYVPDDDQ